MKNVFRIVACLFMFFPVAVVHAHFGLIIPSQAMVENKKDADITLDIAFAHPFTAQGMDMAKPRLVTVYANGRKTELNHLLKPARFLDHAAWQTNFKIASPGVYQVAVEPQPYFEPAEDLFIIHYPKTYVAAFNAEDGWDQPFGLPVEIVPLTRPFGNYAGNIFQGLVLANGKPAPGVTVEVENLNLNGAHAAPNPWFETQVAKTGPDGVFSWGIPWAGWWGFAAILPGNEKLEKDGVKKDVELGAILWLNFASAGVAGQEK